MNKSQVIGMIKSLAGRGGASNWNDLQDKPFGEVYGDTLLWEIDPASLDFDSLPGGFLVKISDAIVTMDDLSGGAHVESPSLCISVDVAAEKFVEYADGFISADESFLFFVDERAVGVELDGLVFEESGVYVIVEFVSGALTIPGYTKFITTKKLDEKYLPDTATNTVVLYVGLDADGVRRIYKDFARTEGLVDLELFKLIHDKNALVVSISDNECSFVMHAHAGGITYAVNTYHDSFDSSEPSFSVAFSFPSGN